jgi:addiction module RelB/DinJ family antitoxin
MHDTTVISVKTDKKTKLAAQKVAHDLGIPLSTILNAHLRALVREKTVSVSLEHRLRPEKERELLKLVKEARAGKNISPTFSNMEDALAWLHKKENA